MRDHTIEHASHEAAQAAANASGRECTILALRVWADGQIGWEPADAETNAIGTPLAWGVADAETGEEMLTRNGEWENVA